MKYWIILVLVGGCQVTSITPSGQGPGVDISVDWSTDVIRHGLTYFGHEKTTEVNSMNMDSIRRGQKLYEAHCQKCHGPKGQGGGELAEALNIKPADLSKLHLKSSKPLLIMVVQRGRKSMPSWESILTNNQSVDVTNYIMTLGHNK